MVKRQKFNTKKKRNGKGFKKRHGGQKKENVKYIHLIRQSMQ